MNKELFLTKSEEHKSALIQITKNPKNPNNSNELMKPNNQNNSDSHKNPNNLNYSNNHKHTNNLINPTSLALVKTQIHFRIRVTPIAVITQKSY